MYSHISLITISLIIASKMAYTNPYYLPPFFPSPSYYVPPPPSSPAPSPPSPQGGDKQNFLDTHNAARRNVTKDGKPVELPSLVWNDTLATYALNYANKRRDCQMKHSGGPYGENIAMGQPLLSAKDAVAMWVGEKPNYVYDTNTCNGNGGCGHYTQVVWKTTTRLGCALLKCNGDLGVFGICSYDPPGNYVGQRPY